MIRVSFGRSCVSSSLQVSYGQPDLILVIPEVLFNALMLACQIRPSSGPYVSRRLHTIPVIKFAMHVAEVQAIYVKPAAPARPIFDILSIYQGQLHAVSQAFGACVHMIVAMHMHNVIPDLQTLHCCLELLTATIAKMKLHDHAGDVISVVDEITDHGIFTPFDVHLDENLS